MMKKLKLGSIKTEITQFQLSYFKSEKMLLWKCCTQYASKFGKQQGPQDWKRSVFIPILKKGSAKECSNCCTIALISHASKVKLSKPGFSSMLTVNFQMFKLVLEKAGGPEIKLPVSVGSLKKQECSRKTSLSDLLTIPKPLTLWIRRNWKILKETGIPDHLTCLLRNLFAVQEATVRPGYGTTNWFQIGKGVGQGCILSPCLFNLHAEYIMRNTGLNETQAGIKIAWRNINDLRYADDTPLWQKVKKN